MFQLCLLGGWFVYQQRNEVHNNCGIEIYYQTDMQSTSENMFLELFCQIISEPCFNTLRTKEQLGKFFHSDYVSVYSHARILTHFYET